MWHAALEVLGGLRSLVAVSQASPGSLQSWGERLRPRVPGWLVVCTCPSQPRVAPGSVSRVEEPHHLCSGGRRARRRHGLHPQPLQVAAQVSSRLPPAETPRSVACWSWVALPPRGQGRLSLRRCLSGLGVRAVFPHPTRNLFCKIWKCSSSHSWEQVHEIHVVCFFPKVSIYFTSESTQSGEGCLFL